MTSLNNDKPHQQTQSPATNKVLPVVVLTQASRFVYTWSHEGAGTEIPDIFGY